MTCYDWHGGYGHPDHIQVHRVGHRAAELHGSVRLFESTMNRTRMVAMMRENPDRPDDWDPEGPADDGNPFGSTEDEITMAVDVSAYIDQKRRSIMCHASQMTDSGFFVQMPPEVFAIAFGTEWFIEPGASGGAKPGWLL
jgi:LmbE family N-acetylglucosaminyl deacetylase